MLAISKGGKKVKSAQQITSAEELSTQEDALFQNAPNPFTERTQINYYLTEGVKEAAIYIYNMNGVQIESFNLQQKGHGTISINGGLLQAGMYMYSLIADGQAIDTKTMILTH